MAQKTGGSKSSKRDQPTRKRYIAENRRDANKTRRMAKHGKPNNGSEWAAECLIRKARRAVDPEVQKRAQRHALAREVEQAPVKVDLGQI